MSLPTPDRSGAASPVAAPAPTELATSADYLAFLDRYDTFLFDLDGVVWRGNELVPGAKEALDGLRARGKKLLFITNNATKSRAAVKAKFAKLGISVSIDEIFSSAYASALYISRVLELPADKKVYVIGMHGIEDELREVGISFAGGTDPEDNVFLPYMDFSSIKNDESVGAVVCGFDMHINYKKLAKAFTYLTQNPDCHFILTNDDSTFPVDGSTMIGAGGISAPLLFSTKRVPTIIGKPHRHMLESVLAATPFDSSRAVMIGDRLDTDILFGLRGGLSTLLVYTGVTKREEIMKAAAGGAKEENIMPEWAIGSLGDLKDVI